MRINSKCVACLMASIALCFVSSGAARPPPCDKPVVAVITSPNSKIKALPIGTTPVVLDATCSRVSPDNTITQYVWAVITLPDKRRVTNSTGRITQVMLQPGRYQVGLLVVDDEGDNDVAIKDIEVGT